MTSVDPAAVSDLLKNAMQQVGAQRSGMMFFFKAVLTLVWLYAVVDAYLVADKKINQKSEDLNKWLQDWY